MEEQVVLIFIIAVVALFIFQSGTFSFVSSDKQNEDLKLSEEEIRKKYNLKNNAEFFSKKRVDLSLKILGLTLTVITGITLLNGMATLSIIVYLFSALSIGSYLYRLQA